MLDLHVHLLGHRERKATKDNILAFLEEAKRKNLYMLGFADHDQYWEELNLKLIPEVALEFPELQVRVGLEVDFRGEEEKTIRERLTCYPFDYVIGSVHQIGGWFFDYPEEELIHRQKDADTVYREYFSMVEKAAVSGLFHIIGHFDLIKIFNLRPKTDVKVLAGRALEAIKENGLAIEVNTNGRYKPVNEFYPELKLIEMIKEMEIPLTLGSDAHEAQVIGRDLSEACELLRKAGIREVVGFTAGNKEIISLID